MAKRLLLATTLLIIATAPVFGAAFTINNTGASGAAGSGPDANWALISCPAGSVCVGASEGSPASAYITDDAGYPFSGLGPLWKANDGSSKWISPLSTYNTGLGDVGGEFTYRTSFDLTGFVASTATLSFQLAVDNNVVDVKLNGVSSGITASGFQQWVGGDATPTQFVLTGLADGFVSGLNNIDFIVNNNQPDVVNPSGLRVLFSNADADSAPSPEVPEPASMSLLGLGLLGLGVMAHRRRRQA